MTQQPRRRLNLDLELSHLLEARSFYYGPARRVADIDGNGNRAARTGIFALFYTGDRFYPRRAKP